MKSKKEAVVSLVVAPDDFFKEEISRAFSKQKLKEDVDVQSYLTSLLTKFMLSENFYKQDPEGTNKQDTLALLFFQASQTPDHARKCEDLRRLGDVSLYTAGFFSDSLSRKCVDMDYYISMGQGAYNNLAGIIWDNQFRKIFTALSGSFVKFVDVLAEVSALSLKSNARDLLRTYEVWLKTGSERAETLLKEAGIIPDSSLKGKVQ